MRIVLEKWYLTSIALSALLCLAVIIDHQPQTRVIVLLALIASVTMTIQVQRWQHLFFLWRYSTTMSMRSQGHYFYYGFPRAHREIRTENDHTKERITGVAQRHPNGLIFVGYEPLRHHHVQRAMDDVGMAGIKNTRDAGFITNTGRYVNRIEASFIAQKAGQVKCLSQGTNRELFSEDVWP